MADDIGQVGSAEEEIKSIEKRLEEIGGYKFIPPSIQEERLQLQKKLEDLKLKKDQPKPEFNRETPDAVEELSTEPPLVPQFASPPTDDFTIDQKPETASEMDSKTEEDVNLPQLEPIKREESSPAKLWSLPDRDNLQPIEVKKQDEAEKPKEIHSPVPPIHHAPSHHTNHHHEERKEEHGFEAKKEIASASELVNRGRRFIETLRSELGKNFDHPDREYLSDVVKSFDKSLRGLEDRIQRVEMTAEQKSRAIAGRMSSYLKAVKAEFDFSGLLNEEIKRKITHLIGQE